jgi:uncharacterized protein (TIGR00369 family)
MDIRCGRRGYLQLGMKMAREQQPADLERCRKAFENLLHCRAFGMKVTHLEHGKGSMSIAYQKDLIGDTRSGVVHGGVITALLDSLGGLVAMSSVPDGTAVATLDLRIDYLRPATPGEAIRATAECHTVTKHVAFVRGAAYDESATDPIAHCTGAFMIGATGYTSAGADLHLEAVS